MHSVVSVIQAEQKLKWRSQKSNSSTAISHVKHVRAPQKRTRLTTIHHQPCSSCTVCTRAKKEFSIELKKHSDFPQTLHSPELLPPSQTGRRSGPRSCSPAILGTDPEDTDDECCPKAEARDKKKIKKMGEQKETRGQNIHIIDANPDDLKQQRGFQIF